MAELERGAPSVKYVVNLSAEERALLQQLVRTGRAAARRVTRARIPLKADEGLPDAQVAAALDVGIATVHRIRQRCVEEGLEAALGERPRSGAPALLSGRAQAHLIALACSEPPDGRPRWTLRLLADRVVELGIADRCSYETVRRVLKKRPEALAATALVHSHRRSRVRRSHGGCARPVCGALPSHTPSGLLR